MLPNLALLANLGFWTDSYEEDINEREDSGWEIGCGVDYKFYKYVSLGAGYRYVSVDSNINENDYSDNLASVNIKGIL